MNFAEIAAERNVQRFSDGYVQALGRTSTEELELMRDNLTERIATSNFEWKSQKLGVDLTKVMGELSTRDMEIAA